METPAGFTTATTTSTIAVVVAVAVAAPCAFNTPLVASPVNPGAQYVT
jgi:hypothetical protein